jgi:hypothetical protein
MNVTTETRRVGREGALREVGPAELSAVSGGSWFSDFVSFVRTIITIITNPGPWL